MEEKGLEGAMDDPGTAMRLAAAEAVAREAGAVALAYYMGREALVIESKGPQDIVSEADRAVERLIRARLARLFPEDGFIGEEDAPEEPAAGGGHWVIDPIDGTWCFLNGIGAWCVSLGYVRRSVIELGVIVDPCARELFAAARGEGARLNGRPIAVSDATRLDQGTVSVGFSTRVPPALIAPAIDSILKEGGLYHRHGSGALGLAWTACGRLIGYIEPHMNSWDAVAGLALVEAAGGRSNDFLADDGLHHGNPIIAASPGVMDRLTALAEGWKEAVR